ncbi:hypothetical protein JCM19233_3505 [Vibrio astriarenae]|nr:hypothetical protein JCM19233_3505 [Vibrio sp. C7]
MKRSGLWITLSLFILPTANASIKSDIEQQWRVANEVVNDESIKVTIQAADFNDDGALDYAVYSSYFCGSQGCIYDIYSKINGKYCQVGKYDLDIALFEYQGEFTQCSDNFLSVANQNRSPQEPKATENQQTHASKADTTYSNTGLVSISLKTTYARDITLRQVPIPTLIIQAVTDSVTLQGVTINRGHCPTMSKTLDGRPLSFFPSSLQFGQKKAVGFRCSIEDVLEVKVHTNLGNESFEVTD